MSFFSMIDNCYEEFLELETALCRIPAPSNNEGLRVEFVKKWLEPYGPVHVDDADNVVFTGFDTGASDALLICAHTDTVFPDLTPFEPVIEDGKYYCPAAGDDTANLAGMMLLIKYLVLNGAEPKRPVIFAANSGEEGLGNLRGSKELISTYGSRLGGFISFDGSYRWLVNNAVGSHRYKVTVKTPGGHSYGAFGNRSAIAAIAELITDLYRVTVPTKAKTTYNAGMIEGGTSVNTIAQSASMLYEYRSEDMDCLEYMKEYFEAAIARANAEKDTEVTYEVLGIRPCRGIVDEAAQKKLEDQARVAIEKITGNTELPAGAGSTDCNIPLSQGIPAICFGMYLGHGAHTREEYIELQSVLPGMKILASLMEEYFEI